MYNAFAVPYTFTMELNAGMLFFLKCQSYYKNTSKITKVLIRIIFKLNPKAHLA